jgi:hypothetical protein
MNALIIWNIFSSFCLYFRVAHVLHACMAHIARKNSSCSHHSGCQYQPNRRMPNEGITYYRLANHVKHVLHRAAPQDLPPLMAYQLNHQLVQVAASPEVVLGLRFVPHHQTAFATLVVWRIPFLATVPYH